MKMYNFSSLNHLYNYAHAHVPCAFQLNLYQNRQYSETNAFVVYKDIIYQSDLIASTSSNYEQVLCLSL